MINKERDKELMQMAVELSRKSCHEKDDRTHPFVGAVIANLNGEIISKGFRGQHTPGNHAEQEALKNQRDDVLRNAIVYTTLEPCNVRGEQASCCSRLIKAKVSEVVIGMLDPNRDIRGNGWWELEENRIRVRYFDPDIVQEIHQLNSDFIDYQRGVGLLITTIQPEGSPEGAMIVDHTPGQEMLAVTSGKLTVRGSYRVKPTRGDRIVMFVHRGNRYFPQQGIDFDHDRDKGLWQAPSVWVRVAGKVTDNELVIARVSDDLNVAFQHYNTVHSDMLKDHKIDRWIGVIMQTEPPGFERLESLWVHAAK